MLTLIETKMKSEELKLLRIKEGRDKQIQDYDERRIKDKLPKEAREPAPPKEERHANPRD